MSQSRNLPLVLQAKLHLDREGNRGSKFCERGGAIEGYFQSLYKLRFYNQDQPNSCRFETVVNSNILFERTESKVITWTLIKQNIQMALSFRQEAGANNFWNYIDQYLRKDAVHVQVNSRQLFLLQYRIPDPAPQTLQSILDELNSIPTNEKRQRICSIFLTKRDLLPKLRLLFNQLETNPTLQIDNLKRMFQLIKTILNFGDTELLYQLLSDEYVNFTFGCLEYDPSFINCPHKHRQYLANQARFTQVIPIKNKERLKHIHFTYRLQYIKDCALAHLLDDGGLRIQSIIVLSNYRDTLVNFIFNSKEKDYLNELFNLLRQQDVRAYRLLAEICRIAKVVDLLYVGNQQTEKEVVYNQLADKQIYEILCSSIKQFEDTQPGEMFVSNSKSKLRSYSQLKEIAEISLEFIIGSLEVCPKYFRSYCVSERQKVLKYPLINFLFKAIRNSVCFSFQVITRILSLIVDNTQFHQIIPIAQSAFVDIFLSADKHFQELIVILNKLVDNISDTITEKLILLIAKLLTVIATSKLSKSAKISVFQILRKMLSIYLTEPDLKQSVVTIMMENVTTIVDQLISSKAHSSACLSTLLSMFKIFRLVDSNQFLQQVNRQLGRREAKNNIYLPKLINYVRNIIEWKEIPLPDLKRDRTSQVTLGEQDFQSNATKKMKPS